jgi:hypothetical protein
VAVFQWPSGWVVFTIPPERPAAYKPAPGGLAVAIDLTREITGARLEAPMRGLATSEEISEAFTGPTMSYEEARRRPPSAPPYTQLPLREAGRPLVKPTTVFTDRGPLPVNPMEYSAEHFRRVYNMSREEALAEVRKVTGPVVRAPPKPVLRREVSVALIPAAGVQRFQDYLRRLPFGKRSVPAYVFGAAWAIYTSEVRAAPFGFFTQPLPQRGLGYSPYPPGATPPARTTQSAYVPPQQSAVTETLATDVRGGRFVPVMYFTVAALIQSVMGTPLRAPDFDHAIEKLRWHVCGRIPRTGNSIYCPDNPATRPFGVIPLPSAEDFGEAPPIAAPEAGQQRLSTPAFRERGIPPPPPPPWPTRGRQRSL